MIATASAPLELAALAYAAMQWPVAPLHSIRGGVCSCVKGAECDRSPGKHPRTENGLDDATTDPGVVAAWWSRWSDANIAIRCDRLFVLDVDPRHGGDLELAGLQAEHGALPATLLIKTGGGGWHHYFTAEPRKWRKQIRPGLDVQAGRGKYVLAPPSGHVSGGTYRIEVDVGLAPAPAWLVRLATAPDIVAAPAGTSIGCDALLEKRVRGYLARCAPAVSGSGGHAHTFLVAQHVVRGFSLDAGDAYALLAEWNQRCEPPWSEADLRRKLHEAREKGSRIEWGAHLRDDRPRPAPRLTSVPSSASVPSAPREREPGEDDEAAPTPATPRAPAPAPRLFGLDAREFLGNEDDDEDDSQDWVVRGLILRGAPNVIAGTPKGKKTMVALHLAICVAAGLPTWLDRFPVRGGRVLVLAHEDAKRETRRRIWRLARGMGIDPRSLGDTLRIADRSETFHFDRPDELVKLVGTLDTWRPSVVLMDSLSRMHLQDENSKKDMNVVTEAWLNLCSAYDVAIVAIHHLVKIAETKDLILQLRGSGDIGAAVRHAVGVAKDPKEPSRSRIWTDGNEQYHPEPFDLAIIDGTNDQGKPTISFRVEASDLQRIVEAIVAELRRAPLGLGTAELRSKIKGRGEDVDAAAVHLEKNGRIYRASVRKKWQLQEGA